MSRRARFAVVATMLCAAGFACAQDVTRIIVPFSAGGGGDLIARTLAPRLGKALGRTFVVENKAGAGGQIGMQFVKDSPSDGSVVVLASDQAAIVVPLSSARAGYDTSRDFAPLGQVARFPYALVASKTTGARDLDQFIDYLKTHPSKADVGIPGSGGIPELIAKAVAQRAGVAVTTVPYSGANPIIPVLIGGQLTAAAVGLNNALPLHAQGKAQIVAVTGAKRSPLLPQVATFDEAGFVGLKLVSSWTFYAPRDAPSKFIDRFSSALAQALREPEVRNKIQSLSMEVVPLDPAQTKQALLENLGEWRTLLKQQHGLPATR
jgi:tripartite-type tricarboxylate transporter receptor subunit TctC